MLRLSSTIILKVSIISTMPKVKKIRSAALEAQQTRHAPLGQVIQDDEDRGKYAMLSKSRRRSRSQDDDDQEELLDEKTSSKILEMSREQQLEMEMEEQRERQASRRGVGGKEKQRYVDSDDEDEDEESVLLDEYEAE